MTLFIATIAGLINFMIGGLWYGLLFQKPWIEAMGINPEDIGKNGDGKKEMIMTLIVEVIISMLTILFLSALNAATPINAMIIGLIAILSGLKNYFFEKRPLKLILINESYKLMAFIILIFRESS